MGKAFLALVRVLAALLADWRARKARARVDAVRADPGGQWLRKFGGGDKRPASGAGDARSRSDGNMDV